jgi:mRNA interferase YafQ
MVYFTSRKFEKQFSKLPKSLKTKVILRLELFTKDPFDSLLNNHPLRGEWRDYRSININADFRAIYKMTDGVAYFMGIGTHSELYE